MRIVTVDSPSTVDIFHQVPRTIYQHDPHWIPYLRQDVEKVFDRKKNKLYAEGGEAVRWILYNDQDRPIGRIAVFINPKVVSTTKFKTGGLGFFECINDQAAAHFLFGKAVEWLRERGMEAVDGPINFGERDRFWGCQITNFEEPPIYPMNYNPPYYKELFESYGFGVYFEQYMYWRSMREEAQPIFFRKYQQLKEDPDFDVRNIRGMRLDEVAEHFREVYNGAWGGHSHFKELSAGATQKIFRAMKPAIDPDLFIFAYHGNRPIGFYISLPELNQIFCHVNGNLNLLGKLKFLYHKLRKTPTRATGIIFGVVRTWQGKGVEAALIVYASKTLIPKNVYQDTVLTWIGDFNPKMIKVAENLGTRKWRTLYTYRFQFDRTLPFERCPIVE